MQGWLELWGASAQPVGRAYMTWMAGSPTGAHEHAVTASGVATMPGMASADDLKQLRASTGKDLDVLFLQLMLRHHEGGAEMLSYAATNASQEPVRNLAAQMLVVADRGGGLPHAAAHRPRRHTRCRYRRTVPSALTVQPGLWATSQT